MNWVLGFAVWAVASSSSAAPGIAIPGGRFAPLFGLDRAQESLPVAAFALDAVPVSNEDFAQFLQSAPSWKPGSVSKALADSKYLSHLDGGVAPVDFTRAPVTWVSWFAAEAYCESKGGRLPTTLEWEYVAAADETRRDASKDARFVERILGWYSKPFSTRDLLGPGSPPNAYGIAKLHGVAWEWTLDFNGVFVTGDNRQDGDKQSQFFCGNASTGSARREDYAAFMRYALRASLKSRSTLGNLSFRCAYDVKEPAP